MIENYKLEDLEKRCKTQLDIFNCEGRVVLTGDDCKIILELIQKYREVNEDETHRKNKSDTRSR